MSTYQDILTWTPVAILSLIAELGYAQSWDGGSERVFGQGSGHIVTIGARNREENQPENLAAQASILLKRGNYAEAEHLLKQSLEIASNALGTDHPQIAALLVKLGSLYFVQRRYTEAERHLRLSLKINEKVFGHDHLDVAANLEALAFALEKQHRDEEARRLQTRAFEIWSKHRDIQTIERSEPPPG